MSVEKSTEVLNAIVRSADDLYFIEIEVGDENVMIPMSEDKSNEVKSAFNKLINRLKDGRFRIELEDPGEDLFSQVAKEYISQLNREIQEVYGDMENYGLVES